MDQYIYGNLNRQAYRLVTSGHWTPEWKEVLQDLIISFDSSTARHGYQQRQPVSFQYLTTDLGLAQEPKRQIFQQTGLDSYRAGFYAHGYVSARRQALEYGDSFLAALLASFRDVAQVVEESAAELSPAEPQPILQTSLTPPRWEVMLGVLDALYSSKRVILITDRTGDSFYLYARMLAHWIYQRLPYRLRQRVGCNLGCTPAQIGETNFPMPYKLLLLEDLPDATLLRGTATVTVLRADQQVFEKSTVSGSRQSFYRYLYEADAPALSRFFADVSTAVEEGVDDMRLTPESYVAFYSAATSWRSGSVEENLPGWIFQFANEDTKRPSRIFPTFIEVVQSKITLDHMKAYFSREYLSKILLSRFGAAPLPAQRKAAIASQTDENGFFALDFFVFLLDEDWQPLAGYLADTCRSMARDAFVRANAHELDAPTASMLSDLGERVAAYHKTVEELSAPKYAQIARMGVRLAVQKAVEEGLSDLRHELEGRYQSLVKLEMDACQEEIRRWFAEQRMALTPEAVGELVAYIRNADGARPYAADYEQQVLELLVHSVERFFDEPCTHYEQYRERAEFWGELCRGLPIPQAEGPQKWVGAAWPIYRDVSQLSTWGALIAALRKGVHRFEPTTAASILQHMGEVAGRLRSCNGTLSELLEPISKDSEYLLQAAEAAAGGEVAPGTDLYLVGCYLYSLFERLKLTWEEGLRVRKELDVAQQIAAMLGQTPVVTLTDPQNPSEAARLTLEEACGILGAVPDGHLPPLPAEVRVVLARVTVMNFFLERARSPGLAHQLLRIDERVNGSPLRAVAALLENEEVAAQEDILEAVSRHIQGLSEREAATLKRTATALPKQNPWRKKVLAALRKRESGEVGPRDQILRIAGSVLLLLAVVAVVVLIAVPTVRTAFLIVAAVCLLGGAAGWVLPLLLAKRPRR